MTETKPPPAWLIREQQAALNRAGRRKQKAAALSLQPGQPVTYRPPLRTQGPHAPDGPKGQRAGADATVVRAARADVRNPTLRIEFSDGVQFTVPAAHVGRRVYRDPSAPAETPHALSDARGRPAWGRLVNALDDLNEAEYMLERVSHDPEAADAQVEAARGRVRDLAAAAEHRAAQLAGAVAPRGSERDLKRSLAADLLRAARGDLLDRLRQAAGRTGKFSPPAEILPDPTLGTDEAWLEQQDRAMVNAVARAIHRRYFLSDAELDPTPRALRPSRRVRELLREAGRGEDRAVEVSAPRLPSASELHGQADEARLAMTRLALEVCQHLAAGNERQAQVLLGQQQEQRRVHLHAQAAIDAQRPQVVVGRFFHGDILSVRDEHVTDSGEYLGMTQYYTRLVIIHDDERGFGLIVANARELESRTTTRVGAEGWRDLVRWILDLADRGEGRRQGRRQDDDRHLIYRDHDGHLELRESVRDGYPHLVTALECVRRSLDPRQNDVPDDEVPARHPARGFHPFQREDGEIGGT